jgi:hypothetical protein
VIWLHLFILARWARNFAGVLVSVR